MKVQENETQNNDRIIEVAVKGGLQQERIKTIDDRKDKENRDLTVKEIYPT